LTGGIRRAQWANPPVSYFATAAVPYPRKVQKNIGTLGLPFGTYLEQNYERRSRVLLFVAKRGICLC
jgi:hypothetical protein